MKSCFHRQREESGKVDLWTVMSKSCFCGSWSKTFRSHCFIRGRRKDRDSQASTDLLNSSEDSRPVQNYPPGNTSACTAGAAHTMLHHQQVLCSLCFILLLVFYTALFSFLLLVHTQTCLHKPVARGHYPKGNLDSKTHTCASSSELLWRYSLVPR